MEDLLSVMSDIKGLNENYDVWQFIRFLVRFKNEQNLFVLYKTGKNRVKIFATDQKDFAHHVSIDLFNFEFV